MSCDGADSVAVMKTNAKRIKDGKLRRYKDKLFGDKWPETYAVLYQDSTFLWYDDESERTPRGSLQIKDYAPFLAVGSFTTRLPDRPALPSGAKADHALAIGTGATSKSKIHWFLCHGDEDLNSWMAQIISTLPPPPQPPQPPPLPPPQTVPNNGPGPQWQPYTQPPPNYGPAAGYPVAAPAYYQQPQFVQPQPTVVVAGGQPSYQSYGSGFGGAALGLGAGALLGYGLGSLTGPHFGGGWGGYGYGGGYGYSDNDTTIINNYNTVNNTDYQQADNFDYGGGDPNYGGDGGNFDYGGDDYGGGDFGGGDGGWS